MVRSDARYASARFSSEAEGSGRGPKPASRVMVEVDSGASWSARAGARAERTRGDASGEGEKALTRSSDSSRGTTVEKCARDAALTMLRASVAGSES